MSAAGRPYLSEAWMSGILKIAYKLLINGRAKFAALLVGITFAVFLMIEMTSLFAGRLNRSSATVINIIGRRHLGDGPGGRIRRPDQADA